MAIEIVDLPINSMVIFYSYVNVYQRVCGRIFQQTIFDKYAGFDEAPFGWLTSGFRGTNMLPSGNLT